mmetsp:Transcript_22247/g.68550  ORF Transcript_22247/g.68550 Transcript_22247/m.68550 type:complete len:662 (-) Transcript_22247:305-2290(-)
MGGVCSANDRRGASAARRRTSSFSNALRETRPEALAALFALDDLSRADAATGKRTTLTLQELCARELCKVVVEAGPRAGSLPGWLPPDLTQRVVDILVEHRALTLGGLAALRDCDLQSLSLQGCRGVNDTWFVPLSSSEIPRSLTALDVGRCREVSDLGLRTLGCLPLLEKLNLSGCDALTGAALAPLHVSGRLRVLGLKDCRNMTPDGLAAVTGLPLLEDLDLTSCGGVGDGTLKGLAGLRRLKRLILSQCSDVTDRGVAYLAGMIDDAVIKPSAVFIEEVKEAPPSPGPTDVDHDGDADGLLGEAPPALPDLAELDLGWCAHITDSACMHLGNFPALSRLCLSRTKVGNLGVRRLAQIQSLRHVGLSGLSRLTDLGLTSLRRLENLESLDVSSCGFVTSFPPAMPKLRELNLNHTGIRDRNIMDKSGEGFTSLQSLSMDSCGVNDRGVKLLFRHLEAVEHIDLADLSITHEGIVGLTALKRLRSVNLFYCNVNAEAVRLLSNVKSITAINLDNREIGDAALRHLVDLPNLTKLDVYSAGVTDDGIASLVQITTLVDLEVCGGRVANRGCGLIANSLTNLTNLNLSHNFSISTSGMMSLANLTKLRSLSLAHSFRVTSASLPYIGKLLNLEHLSLAGTSISEEDALRLQLCLPRLQTLRV